VTPKPSVGTGSPSAAAGDVTPPRRINIANDITAAARGILPLLGETGICK
jgi:hypothetical protein